MHVRNVVENFKLYMLLKFVGNRRWSDFDQKPPPPAVRATARGTGVGADFYVFAKCLFRRSFWYNGCEFWINMRILG